MSATIEAARSVLGAVTQIGGEVDVGELARKTRLPELDVVDALYDLEHRGLVTPTRWKQGPNPVPTLPLR